MKSRVHNFESYLNLNETSAESIAADFPQEWKRLEDLGFYDATTPIVSKNGNVILKNRRFDYYPEGIVLQPASGYVRDRAVRSGFLKNGLDLKGMLDYLIDRYSKYENQQRETGLSERVYGIIRRYVSKFKLNPTTGRIDLPGSIGISGRGADDMLDEGVKFGKVGDFSLTGEFPYNQKSFRVEDDNLSLTIEEAKEFLPTDSEGNFRLHRVRIGNYPFSINIERKWNPVGKLDLMINGTSEEKRLASMLVNTPEEIQEMIDSDPTEMAVALKSIWNDLKRSPEYKDLKFPDKYSKGADLLSDLTDIGL
jgi:hypothetical protein